MRRPIELMFSGCAFLLIGLVAGNAPAGLLLLGGAILVVLGLHLVHHA